MDTIVRKINPQQFSMEELKEAINILKAGGLVSFPTETVYGLGADGLKEEAAGKIYEAKGRPCDNPLIIHIADMDSLKELAQDIPADAYKLAEKFWPGPLTMIFNKSKIVPYGTTGGLDTVAVRMPKEPISHALIRESGVYIAAPSANTSGRPSPTLAKHVIEDLSGKIDMIIDGGPVGIGLESTIVDMTEKIPVILRPGYITMGMIEEVIGRVAVDKSILERSSSIKPKAPGMKYKHYAPKGDIAIMEGRLDLVISEINNQALQNEEKGKKVGIITTEETACKYVCGIVKTVGARNNTETIARKLFAVLREFDEEEVDIIFSESFSDDNLGQAIMNRLLKAAGYHVVTV